MKEDKEELITKILLAVKEIPNDYELGREIRKIINSTIK